MAYVIEHGYREYPLYLYPFRFRDPLTGKWRKARYRAELRVIRERYSEFELDGEPMVITGRRTADFNLPRRLVGLVARSSS